LGLSFSKIDDIAQIYAVLGHNAVVTVGISCQHWGPYNTCCCCYDMQRERAVVWTWSSVSGPLWQGAEV